MWNQIKTVLLLGSLSGILLLLGNFFGGEEGVIMAFILAIFMNGIAYFYSDKLVLSMYGAQPLDRTKYEWIYEIVEELTHTMRIPMPKLWLINTPMANAFATGRNPDHASVAVTTGILELLDKEELRGVLAHELGHVVNRDILVSSIAATLAGAIGYLANWLYWSAIFGGNRDRRNGSTSPIAMMLISFLVPIAASLIQLAVSRSREFLADETGAKCCHDPLALASALKKLQQNVPRAHLDQNNASEASTAHLFIVNPFTTDGFLISLFSTHPPMKQRIERLEKMHEKLF
jgi:heat shock protein HtpX